ncbi:MAG: response regulator transcription factor [Prolixibacteraceae bacterium]|jgi:DNA-binding NarL/FixJ family response regulator|nr:response regulator transcription factor [Prolixibacteraceae bacterium]
MHGTHHVVIADSQYLVVETLRNMILEEAGFSLTGITRSKSELLNLLSAHPNTLLITDIATIDYSSIDDLKTIKGLYPLIKVLVLTNVVSKSEFLWLSKIGIRNVVYKNVDKDELWSAIQSTLKGKKSYSDEILDLYLDLGESKFVTEESKTLTTSEIEIVRMIANGLTTKEIAFKRNISNHTVSTHRKNIFKKIGVTNASELIIHAIKAGWIDNIEYYI